MLTIRQFRPDDAEAVRELFSHAQDGSAQSYQHRQSDREGFHEYIEGALNHDLAHVERSYLQRFGSNFWVAELAGRPVGCIGAYRRDDEEAEICRLAVDQSARRRGVASRLLDQAEAFCRDAGYARAIVWTANHMTAAIAFLQHRGYHELEDHPFPHTSLTLYLYALDL